MAGTHVTGDEVRELISAGTVSSGYPVHSLPAGVVHPSYRSFRREPLP